MDDPGPENNKLDVTNSPPIMGLDLKASTSPLTEVTHLLQANEALITQSIPNSRQGEGDAALLKRCKHHARVSNPQQFLLRGEAQAKKLVTKLSPSESKHVSKRGCTKVLSHACLWPWTRGL